MTNRRKKDNGSFPISEPRGGREEGSQEASTPCRTSVSKVRPIVSLLGITWGLTWPVKKGRISGNSKYSLHQLKENEEIRQDMPVVIGEVAVLVDSLVTVG